MINFTKDELQIILLEMNISIQRTPKQLKVSPIYIALRDKVESMVDNYCTHDGEIGKDYPAEKCMKCGAYWE